MKNSKRLLSLSVAFVATLVVAANLWAATFTVNSTGDDTDDTAGDGNCDTDGGSDGPCTLRAAIQEANALSGSDTITLPAGTYTIQTFPCDTNDTAGNIGDYDIRSNLTINGAGAETTIVDGNNLDRVFDIFTTNGPVSATLRGMTIRNGFAAQCQEFLEDGGGIRNSEDLILDRVAVTGNDAEDGGGIANFGSLSILNSTISGNGALGGGENGSGGGIFNDATPETMPIVNSTISGNTAQLVGGGIAHFNGTIQLRNTTITDNEANLVGILFAFGSGGGVALEGFFEEQPPSLVLGGSRAEPGVPELIVRNSIIADNRDAETLPSAPDCLNFNGSIVSEGFNLIGDETGCAGDFNGTGDQVGTAGSPINPLLGPLADNGGPNFTHALLAGSPAIDLANPAGCFANDANNGATLLIDQRGLTRPVDGNDDANVRCDIGAFELQPLCGDGTVNAGEECDDGNATNGDGCASDCTNEPTCGDEAIDSGEECDDGNTVGGDGCSADCVNEVVPACGDGILQSGEECEGGDDCNADCTLAPFCGDGVKDAGEECDDANNVTGDGCSAACLDESGITFITGGFGCNLVQSLSAAVPGAFSSLGSLSFLGAAFVSLVVKRRKLR